MSAKTRTQVVRKVEDILDLFTEKPVTPESTLEELGLERSLLEITMDIEKSFDVHLHEADLPETVEGLVDLIWEKTQ